MIWYYTILANYKIGYKSQAETSPAALLSDNVRRMHNTPIGSTGAAIENPMMMPLIKSVVSIYGDSPVLCCYHRWSFCQRCNWNRLQMCRGIC